MKKAKLSISLAAIVLGFLIVLVFVQNASSVGPHLLPPLAEPATVTPIPFSQNVDLAPSIPSDQKVTLIVLRNDGTYTKLLIAPDTPDSDLHLNPGDRIVAELPPNSSRLNYLPPVATPSGSVQTGTFRGPTAIPLSGSQEPYTGTEP